MRATGMLIAAVLVAGVGSPARACTFEPRSAAENLRAADVAFVGVIASLDQVGTEPVVVTIAVTAVYKGEVPRLVAVRTESSASRCGVAFVPGRAYTVMASLRDGDLWVDLRRGTSQDDRALARAGAEPTVVYTYEQGSGIASLVPPENVAADRTGPIAAAILLLVAVGAGSALAWRARRTSGRAPSASG